MKSIAIALGALATVVAPAVLAQDYYERRDDSSERGYVYVPNYRSSTEFETPRYYRDNYQDYRLRDVRFRDDRFRDDRWNDSRRYFRDGQYECWNPRARHFEGVREGERQDDLDFNRCRSTRSYSRR